MAARQALQHTRLQAQGIPSRAVGAQGDFITGTTAKVGCSWSAKLTMLAGTVWRCNLCIIRSDIGPHTQQVMVSARQPHHGGGSFAHGAAQAQQVHVHIEQQLALF